MPRPHSIDGDAQAAVDVERNIDVADHVRLAANFRLFAHDVTYSCVRRAFVTALCAIG